MNIDVENPGTLIRETRKKRGLSQSELAARVGTKQQTIEKIEAGTIKHSRYFVPIARELHIDLNSLMPEHKPPSSPVPKIIEKNHLLGDKDLPVFAATQGGKGAIIVSTEPVDYTTRPDALLKVRDAYGILVVESSMSPEFEPGDVALIHPHLPPITGRTCVFYSQTSDGTVVACIKRLRRVTPEAWHVREFNDGEFRDFTLKRAEWQKCHVSVGNHKGR